MIRNLAKMGPRLTPDEQDYTGLAALDPDNRHVIYVSTVYDPRDDTTMTPPTIWLGRGYVESTLRPSTTN